MALFVGFGEDALMRLISFSIQNYSLHQDTTVDLKPVTVLVGRNGGGKSALVDALQLLGRTARGSLVEAFEDRGPFSYRARLFHGVEDTASMQFRVRFDPGRELGTLEYELVFGPNEEGALAVQLERLTAADERPILHRETTLTGPKDLGPLPPGSTALSVARRTRGWLDGDMLALRDSAYALGRILRFRIDAWPVGTDSPDFDLTEEEGDIPKEPRLGMRGVSTAAFLYWLRDYNGRESRALEKDVKDVIPGFAGFDFSTARQGSIGFLMRFDDDRGAVDAMNLSSGTLCTVALLAMARFRGAKGSKLLCVEEPELGLTPTAARGVFSKLRASPAES